MALTIILSSCNFGATPAPTQDVGAIQTEAFSQVMTQVVAAYTPTSMPTSTLVPTSTLAAPPTFASIGGGVETATPFAFNTPLPGLTPVVSSPVPTVAGVVPTITTKNGCNDGYYVDETKPPDGTQMKPGEDFTKGWTIKNIGTCPWDDGYSFVANNQWSDGIDVLAGESTSIAIKKPEDFIKPGMSQLFLLKLTTPKAPGKYKWCWKLVDDSGNMFGPLVCTTFEVVK